MQKDVIVDIANSDDFHRLNYIDMLGMNDRLEEELTNSYYCALYAPKHFDC